MNEKGHKNKHEKEILKEEDQAVQGEKKNTNAKKDEVIQSAKRVYTSSSSPFSYAIIYSSRHFPTSSSSHLLTYLTYRPRVVERLYRIII